MATTMNLGTIPYGSVLVQATGTGTITGEWTQPCTDPNSCFISPVPPTGVAHPNICYGPMLVEGAHLSGICGGSETTGLHLLRDSVIVGRKEGTMPTRLNPDGTVLCSAPSCIQWSGTQQLAMTRVPAEASVQAFEFPSGKPATTVYFGQQVQFKVDRTTSVGGVAATSIPLHMFGWTWTASGGGVVRTSLTSSCPWSGTTCTVYLYESGDMTAAAYVNGAGQDPDAHVEVIKRKLKLKVAPATYVKKGTKLTWTSKTDTTIGWRSSPTWAASDSSAYTSSTCVAGAWTCTEYAQKNYIRYHTARIDDSVQTDQRAILVFTRFEVRADNSAPKLGDTVTFKAFIDDSVRQIPRWRWDQEAVDAADCAGDSICVRVMTAPGVYTMTGYTAPEAGVGDSASAAVTAAEPVLHLTASKTRVAPGEIVSFFLTTDGQDSPADAWQFAPDTGVAHADACSGGQSRCDKVFRVSGTMTATRGIAGREYEASTHVIVEGECTGPSLADTTTAAAANLVGQPCGSTEGGDTGPGPTRAMRRLTVIRTGNVLHDQYLSHVQLPKGDDTIAVFGVYADSVLAYKFSPGPGYFDLLVTIDDTIQASGQGTVAMTQDRVLTVDARPTHETMTRAHAYREAYTQLLLGNNRVDQYRALLQHFMVAVAQDPSVVSDMELGMQLVFDASQPTLGLPADQVVDSLAALEAELTGWIFRFDRTSTGTDTVIADFPIVMAADPTRTRAPQLSGSTLPSSPLRHIWYVNGVLTSRVRGESSTSDLRWMLRQLDSVRVNYMPNPTVSEQLAGEIDGAVSECVIRVLNQPPLVPRHRRLLYSLCKAGLKLSGRTTLLAITHNDFVESVRQKIAVSWTKNWRSAPAVASMIQHQMAADADAGRHSIWVGHSQGNFAIAQGIGKLTQSGRQLQQGACTGVVGLASPVMMDQYGVSQEFVYSFTTKYDILLLNFLGDARATQVYSQVIRGIDERPYYYTLEPKPTQAEQREAHAVVPNYLNDSEGSMLVTNAIKSLLYRCSQLQ